MRRGLKRRLLTTAVGALSIAIAACGGGGGGTPAAVNGGTLNLGVWQEQTSFLNAGIVDSQTFSYLIDAPSAEGLLWYRSTTDTASAKGINDYWQPDLATEVPTVENGDVKTGSCDSSDSKVQMCVTWKLRSGVQWADGSTFSSHDVCDTVQFFWLKYGSNNPTALLSTTGWNLMLHCKEQDPQTAVVEFSQAYGPYLALMTGVYGVLPSSLLDQSFKATGNIQKDTFTVDLSKGTGGAAGFKGTATMDKFLDGTGPYVFQSYTPGQQYVFVPNKNYWNKDHQPHLDKLVFKVEPDLSTEVSQIKAGDIQGAFDLRLSNLKTIEQSAQNGKLQVQNVPDSGAEKMDLNLCAQPEAMVEGQSLCGPGSKLSEYTADPIIRKAMLQGIDRQAIVNQIADGKSTVPKDSFLYLGAEWIDDPSIPQTKYDPTAAQKTLDDAGYKLSPNCDGGKYRAYKDGTCIAVNIGTTNSNQGRLDTEQLIAGNLDAIGIKVIQPFTPNVPSSTFFGAYSSGGSLYTHNFDMGIYTNTLSAPAEPDSFFAGYHGCDETTQAACASDPNNNIPSKANGGNGQDDTGINNQQLNVDMEKGHSAVSLSQRRGYYVDAEKILATEIPEIPLYQQVTVDAFASAVQGVQPNDLVWDFNSYDWYCNSGNCQS